MNGFKVVGVSVGEPEIVSRTAGGTIAANDPVTLKTDGQVEVATAGDIILGVALEAATSGNAVNVQVGERLRVLADSDETGDAMAADLVGARFDITGTTGAVKVDVSTAAQDGDGTDTGQLVLLEANPQGYGFDSDTSVGLFEIIERQ